MLPEHVELLKQLWSESEKVPKPAIDPQMREIFARELYEAYANGNLIAIRYYDNGHIKEVTGQISSLNEQKNTVLFENGEKVSFNEIVSIL